MKFSINPSLWSAYPYLILGLIGDFLWGYSTFQSWGYLLLNLPFIFKGIYLSFWRYDFDSTKETFAQTKGVFSSETLEIHYFRIKSIKVVRPFHLRIVGLSNVEVITSEPFCPRLTIYAIKQTEEMAALLEESARHWRDTKGVKEADFHHF